MRNLELPQVSSQMLSLFASEELRCRFRSPSASPGMCPAGCETLVCHLLNDKHQLRSAQVPPLFAGDDPSQEQQCAFCIGSSRVGFDHQVKALAGDAEEAGQHDFFSTFDELAGDALTQLIPERGIRAGLEGSVRLLGMIGCEFRSMKTCFACGLNHGVNCQIEQLQSRMN